MFSTKKSMFVPPGLSKDNYLLLSDRFNRGTTQGFDASGKYYMIFQNIDMLSKASIEVVYFDEKSEKLVTNLLKIDHPELGGLKGSFTLFDVEGAKAIQYVEREKILDGKQVRYIDLNYFYLFDFLTLENCTVDIIHTCKGKIWHARRIEIELTQFSTAEKNLSPFHLTRERIYFYQEKDEKDTAILYVLEFNFEGILVSFSSFS